MLAYQPGVGRAPLSLRVLHMARGDGQPLRGASRGSVGLGPPLLRALGLDTHRWTFKTTQRV